MKGAKNLFDGAALAVLETPPRERLRNRIHVVDHPLGIGGDDPVTDTLQSDLRALFLAKQRFLVQFALGDIELDSDQAQQAALVVDLGLGAADHPAPLARRMTHAMQALENRRFSRHVIANGGLNARHVVRVHQSSPVRRLSHVGFVVPQHRFPARREIDAIVDGVEIPKPVVRAVQGQLIALFQIAQLMLDLDAFEAGGKTAAEQLHQKVQLNFPVIARQRARDPQEACRPAFDEITDDQHRSDTEVNPDGGVIALIAARLAGIAQLRHSQRRQTRLQPREGVQGLTAQLFRVAGGEHAPCHLDLVEQSRLRVEVDMKGSVRARRLAQQLQIDADDLERRCRCHRLEIDGDLGADHIETHGGTNTALRPGRRRQYVRGGQVWVAGIVGCYCHAPSEVPDK